MKLKGDVIGTFQKVLAQPRQGKIKVFTSFKATVIQDNPCFLLKNGAILQSTILRAPGSLLSYKLFSKSPRGVICSLVCIIFKTSKCVCNPICSLDKKCQSMYIVQFPHRYHVTFMFLPYVESVKNAVIPRNSVCCIKFFTHTGV